MTRLLSPRHPTAIFCPAIVDTADRRRTEGGAYLFETKEDADRYLAFHSERLRSVGVTDIDARSYGVNDGLSAITGIPPR